ncbi:AIPR family protein [Streptomyces sp. 2-6]|uniref:AIPR family protein n=1 Tax=Streptomyces sp. 2-6 TaxID=2978333 RepID=UPI003D142A0E
MSSSFLFPASIARRFPAPAEVQPDFRNVETHVLRVRAQDVPAGLPDDANPRDPNLNRQVYRQVRASLLGEDGTGTGIFHLKHGGIVLIAEKLERVEDGLYRVSFNGGGKQGVANGGHTYRLILDAQEKGIPADQYVEFKIHVGVPEDAVPDVADGLNTSMQVRPESLADLRNKFDWLKEALGKLPGGADHVAWHEGDAGDYDVREVIALLMALDPERYKLDNPVGIENTYARLSSVFKAYLSEGQGERVEGFANIAAEAMTLYEYIRCTAVEVFTRKFRATNLRETRANGSKYEFPYLRDPLTGKPRTCDVRLVKPAAIVAFTAFRVLVDVDQETGTASWRYPFPEVLGMWDAHGDELLREFHDALNGQLRGNLHYAGRAPLSYKASTRTLEVADLKKRLANAG